MKKTIHSDVFVGIGLELLCAFFFFYGKSLPSAAKLFPNILLAFIAILSVFVIAEGVKKTKQMNTGEAIASISWDEIRFPLLTFGFSIIYYLLFRYVGYFIATPILLIGLMIFFRIRNWKALIFIPVGYLVFTYVLFVWQLGVRLI